jgi:hypothetical protein
VHDFESSASVKAIELCLRDSIVSRGLTHFPLMCGQGQRHVNGTKNDHQPESAMEDSHAMISLARLVTVLPPSDSPSPRE